MLIITGIQEENTLLNSKLENMTKFVRMLNNGSNVLDEILQVGKSSGNMKGIGFDYGIVNKEIKISTKKFVSPEKKTEFVMLDHMSQHPVRHLNPQPRNKKKPPWIFHNCGRDGHIRPYCYKLYGYPQPHDQPKVSGKIVQARKEWKPKSPNVSSTVTSSVSISVPPVLTMYGSLVQSSLNVADVDNTIDKSVSVLSFKTAIALDVALDVTTSLVQPNQIKFVAESASDNEKSQSKKVFDHEDGNIVSVGDKKDESESNDQSVWIFLISLSEFMAQKGE